MDVLGSGDIVAFHDSCHAVSGWAKSGTRRHPDGVWQAIEDNHRFNCLLWDEEDLARRRNVPDSEIAANKRAIDGYNQRRNDAIERIDERLLAALAGVALKPGARLNSETAGSMTDRLSILSLKIHHMRLQTLRTDVDEEHVETCRAKLARLTEQRADLAGCLDRLLAECARGESTFKVYRQFKMYNDPRLNPAIYGEGSAAASSRRSRRILISYFFAPDAIPLGYSCARALRQLGHEVRTFHSQVTHPAQAIFLKHIFRLLKALSLGSFQPSRQSYWGNDRFRERGLERVLAEFRPEILLVIRGNSYGAAFLRDAKTRYGVQSTAGWWVKEPRSTLEMIEDSKLYDHYFANHQYGYSAEDRIHHLPALGIDADLYRPPGSLEDRRYTHDLLFVGGHNPRRQSILLELLDLPLSIYGPGWRKRGNALNFKLARHIKGRGVWGQDLVRLYYQSKIVLNISGWDTATKGAQNLRVFDVPATGSFLLTDYSDELRSYYEIGKEIETYSDTGELRDKIKYYLSHDVERERIARAGHAKTKRLPRYVERMHEMMAVIGR